MNVIFYAEISKVDIGTDFGVCIYLYFFGVELL